MTDSMLGYVRGQLEQRKGEWPTIAKATGISKRTVQKIASGEIADPRVSKVERLHDYFRSIGGAAAHTSELRA